VSKENLVLKLRVDADPQTIGELDGQSRICNWLYNHLLEKSLELKREFIQSGSPEASKTLYSKRGLRNTLPQLKKDHPFLKAVHSSPLKNTALRLSDAIQVHQKSKKGKRKGKQMGWPKFRAWKQGWFSLFYDEPEKGFRIQGKTLILSLGMGQDGKHRNDGNRPGRSCLQAPIAFSGSMTALASETIHQMAKGSLNQCDGL
jgi:putative transposase